MVFLLALFALAAGQCNDNNACTTDTFVNNVCVYTPATCVTPSDKCLESFCDVASGCGTRKKSVSAIAAICNDNSNCTSGDCVADACVYTPSVTCRANTACAQHSCNPVTGVCDETLTVCDDNDQCTTDTCNATTGCVYTPITCNDNNACAADSCSAIPGCTFTQIPCNDANACTIDSCNPIAGCVYTNVSASHCDDNNACTRDFCSPSEGCRFLPIPCNDGNSCTIDTCNTVTGCVYTPKVCNDQDQCTNDSCDETSLDGRCIYEYDPTRCAACGISPCSLMPNMCQASGCVDQSSNVTTCASPLVPNQAECSLAILTGLRRYCFIYDLPATNCNDNNVCTTDSCNNITGCTFTPITCNDNNACTADSCTDNLGGCQYTKIECFSASKCELFECAPATGICQQSGFTDCNDNNTCTIDLCMAVLGCVYQPLVCNDNNACTTDSCSPVTGCVEVITY